MGTLDPTGARSGDTEFNMTGDRAISGGGVQERRKGRMEDTMDRNANDYDRNRMHDPGHVHDTDNRTVGDKLRDAKERAEDKIEDIKDDARDNKEAKRPRGRDRARDERDVQEERAEQLKKDRDNY